MHIFSTLSRSSLPENETIGLDLESARDATPQWFGVSFGNGNDGVSHTFPDYYVRTNDPWTLARAAVIASFKDEYKGAAAEVVETDGERDCTISATIYDSGSVEGYPEECPSCGVRADSDDEFCECESGPAWLICEVFPIDEMPGCLLITDSVDGRTVEHVQYNPFGKPAYCTLRDAFDSEDIALAKK